VYSSDNLKAEAKLPRQLAAGAVVDEAVLAGCCRVIFFELFGGSRCNPGCLIDSSCAHAHVPHHCYDKKL